MVRATVNGVRITIPAAVALTAALRAMSSAVRTMIDPPDVIGWFTVSTLPAPSTVRVMLKPALTVVMPATPSTVPTVRLPVFAKRNEETPALPARVVTVLGRVSSPTPPPACAARLGTTNVPPSCWMLAPAITWSVFQPAGLEMTDLTVRLATSSMRPTRTTPAVIVFSSVCDSRSSQLGSPRCCPG